MTETERETLLGKLADEYLERLRAGGEPSTEEYAANHPAVADLIRESFPLLRVLRPATARPDPLVPQRLGEFRILRMIGRGGMGVVYEAIQEPLGRRVALKVLSATLATHPASVERFLREARTAGGLHHTNVVPVFAVGQQDGISYYVMQFIDGRALDRFNGDVATWTGAASDSVGGSKSPISTPLPAHSRSGRGSVAEASFAPAAAHYRFIADLGLQAAEALAHAHKQGILHRDIKPSNLLLDSRGTVWVTDFGLAKIGECPELTATGDVVGTLRYMAPERFQGICSTRSDIYSLGATLYELLARKAPFDGLVGAELIDRVGTGRLSTPRQIDRRIPRDLDTVVQTAMALDPADRYASAADMAEDLRRFLADRPIRARRILLAERAGRWCRRNPALTSMGCFAALCLLAGVLLFQWERSRHAEVRAQAERRARLELELEHYFQTIALAERERVNGNTGRAEQLLESCPAELRGWEWYYSRRARYQSQQPWQHSCHLYALAVSPNSERVVAGGSDGSLTVWNSMTGKLNCLIQAHSNQIRGLAFHPDGGGFASASWDGYVRVWSAEGRCLWEKRPGDSAFSVAFNPCNRTVAASFSIAGRPGHHIARWNADTGEDLPILPGHGTVIRRIRFSPDGTLLASADDAGWVKVWDIASGAERATFRAHSFMVFDLAFSRDGSRLATAAGQFFMHGENGEAKIWETNGWQELSAIRTNAGAFYAVTISPDGTRMATGGEDHLVRIWDMATGRETLSLRGHKDAVWGVEFTSDGWGLYSAGGDQVVRHWDARPLSDGGPTNSNVFTGHDGRVVGLAFHPHAPILVSTDMTGAVRIWDVAHGALVKRLPDLPGQAHCAAFSPDGSRLAIGLWRPWLAQKHAGIAVLLETESWTQIERFPLDPVGVLSLAFSPDGAHLAAACDFDVAVVRSDTGDKVWRVKHSTLVTVVAYLPDGSLAAGDADGGVVIYRGTTREVLRKLPGHSGRVTGLAISRNGRRFTSAGIDGSIRVWNVETWQELRRPREHVGGVYAVALSPDGIQVLSAGAEGTIRVWDLNNDQKVGDYRGHTDTIHAVAISGDGHLTASAGRDRTIRVWGLPGLVNDAVRGP